MAKFRYKRISKRKRIFRKKKLRKTFRKKTFKKRSWRKKRINTFRPPPEVQLLQGNQIRYVTGLPGEVDMDGNNLFLGACPWNVNTNLQPRL